MIGAEKYINSVLIWTVSFLEMQNWSGVKTCNNVRLQKKKEKKERKKEAEAERSLNAILTSLWQVKHSTDIRNDLW